MFPAALIAQAKQSQKASFNATATFKNKEGVTQGTAKRCRAVEAFRGQAAEREQGARTTGEQEYELTFEFGVSIKNWYRVELVFDDGRASLTLHVINASQLDSCTVAYCRYVQA